jgi:hypothetical protein
MSRICEELSTTNLPMTTQQHLPATIDDDGWNDAAAEMASKVLRGTLLKFADWKWTKGTEATEVEEGTQLVAVGTAAAWVKWQGGKPVQYEMRQPGQKLPDREALGDMDEALWEPGPDGNPRDPWQSTRFVYLLDPISVEILTFSTSSGGGRSAVIDLADQIARMRKLGRPGALPIVELGSAPMKTQFGRKSKPVLKIVKWYGGGSDTPKEIAPPSLQEETGDEISF